MQLPMRTLTFLFETKQNGDLARRAHATEDQAWAVIGANSAQGVKGLQQHIAQLEAHAAGTVTPATGSADAERIEL